MNRQSFARSSGWPDGIRGTDTGGFMRYWSDKGGQSTSSGCGGLERAGAAAAGPAAKGAETRAQAGDRRQ